MADRRSSISPAYRPPDRVRWVQVAVTNLVDETRAAIINDGRASKMACDVVISYKFPHIPSLRGPLLGGNHSIMS